MIDHVGLFVKDAAERTEFYAKLLAPLGYAKKLEFPGAVCFENAEDGDSVWIESPKSADQKLVVEHIAFRAKDEEAVKAFHAAGLAAGGTDNGQPGPRPAYGPTYYAAFIHDPDGNNIEAMLQ
ncbi:VOC family protein [Bifidobacterium vespertilionis]|uniref:VOC family protein n=1 Tax=Bifidobacterium vespertilionis TaxID=2562524 RepID=A0A5J5DZ10_9BIFI|nr:VOC family protein [Bifidobacterium vespertilionis]KAA8822046.1 VOC family protein [Bifidobacterium vespertilionis]KAA8823513.1 VOC family protein [Bifidobacterium vespertilionis]MBT1179414.1 VOC family protein [Bifidobacterium vespertilionis]